MPLHTEVRCSAPHEWGERRAVSEAMEPGEGQTALLRANRPVRRRRAACNGQSVAEFALIAPMVFLFLLSIVVIGIVVTNFIQVTNVARDGARMAAICAGEDVSPGSIPNGSGLTCSITDLETYMESRLTSIPAGSVTPSIEVCPSDATSCSVPASGYLNGCNTDELIEVQMSYPQPLYLPIVSNIFETSSNGTRALQAKAEAGCE